VSAATNFEAPLLSIGRRVRFGHVRRALLRLPAPATVLDAGCGDGRLARALAVLWPSAAVTGMDTDPAEIAKARVRSFDNDRLTWLCAPIGGPLPTSAFELVLSTDVLEHIPDDDEAMRWFGERLVPGGWLLLHVPATPQRHLFKSLSRAMEREVAEGRGPHMREGYQTSELRGLAAAAGLQVVSLAATFHRRPTRWAADIEAATGLLRQRWLKAILLPLLLLGTERERAGGPEGTGNGHLLLAHRPAR
jgi:SAM-dependent methyltransferase